MGLHADLRHCLEYMYECDDTELWPGWSLPTYSCTTHLFQPRRESQHQELRSRQARNQGVQQGSLTISREYLRCQAQRPEWLAR